jgi:hypothetical protein
MRMGASSDDVSRRLESRRIEEREKWVQSIVTALWDELAAGKGGDQVNVLRQQQSLSVVYPTTATTIDATGDDAQVTTTTTTMTILPVETGVTLETTVKGWDEQVEQILQTLDAVEKRVKIVREGLGVFENIDTLD